MLKWFKKPKHPDYSYTCKCCGKVYDTMPLCFGGNLPPYYYSVPENEREDRIELKESLCVIDDHFFHRGRITIPIIDHHEDLLFNVWTTISRQNFEIRNTLWNDPERVNQQPYFGYLQTEIPTFDNTFNLQVIAIENKIGLIPSIEILDESHPLYLHQQNGITFAHATSIVQTILIDEHHDQA